MFNGEVSSKIVGDQIRLPARVTSAQRTNHLQAGLSVFGGDVLQQRGVTETHLLAEWTGEALRLLCVQHFTTKVQLHIGACQDALHGMIDEVSSGRDSFLIAVCTQIVIVANQAFIATSMEVRLETGITTDTYDNMAGKREGVEYIFKEYFNEKLENIPS